jgi:hypothetical protein
VAPHLWHESVWWDVAWIGFVLMPATFALVLIALPWRTERWVGPAGLVFALLAVIFTVVSFDILANFARLGAATLLGWWFLEFFESLSWVVIVACIIPWVDAYSVWRGPTKSITTNHPHVFSDLSYAFPVPGRHSAANLGVRISSSSRCSSARRHGSAARRPDVDLPRRRPRHHDRADRVVGPERPARAARDRDRVPAAERRPDLAQATRAARAR